MAPRALGFMLLAITKTYVTFVLVFIGLVAMGFQAGFNQPSMSAVNYWFRAKRGFAMSILHTGQAIGGVVLVPLVAMAVLRLGWRSAAVLSGVLVLLTLPLLSLVRRSPESRGLLPDDASRSRRRVSCCQALSTVAASSIS